jgi:polysaccharide export outer membrane protein
MVGTNTVNVQSGVSYFQVDKDGNIAFPIFGTINVGGLTTREISSTIQKRIREEGYINDAVVNTRIMSFKVTVMGDVMNPGTQTYQGERLTILEALGKAGDLNNSALRDHILVVREEGGKRVTYEVNLLDQASVFNSPAYYLQQNDVVYVRPNKSQRVKGSTSYTWLTVGSTVVGMVVSVVSLIVALKK